MSHDGTYVGSCESGRFGRQKGKFIFRSEGNKLTGIVSAMGIEAEIRNGVLNGSAFQFQPMKKLPLLPLPVQMRVKGIFEGETVRGTVATSLGSASFEAKRVAG